LMRCPRFHPREPMLFDDNIEFRERASACESVAAGNPASSGICCRLTLLIDRIDRIMSSTWQRHRRFTLGEAWGEQGTRVDGIASGLIDTKLTKGPRKRLGRRGHGAFPQLPPSSYIVEQTINVDAA
jgi:hypothetical protein